MDATPAPSERRYPYGRASCLTVVGSLGLFAVLFLIRVWPSTPSATLAPEPSWSPPQSVTGSVVIGTDDRTLIYTPGEFCADARLDAHESPDRVTLSVSYRPQSPTDCPRRPPFQTSGVTHLDQPLRQRTLTDAITGTPIPAFHASQALRPPLVEPWTPPQPPATTPGMPMTSPPWTPPPPRPTSPLDAWSYTATVDSAATDFGGPGTATIALRYLPRQSAGGDDPVLVLVATTGAWTPPESTATTPVTVRGHAGRAAPGIVVWTENGLTFAVRIDQPQQPPRPTDQLVSIAALLQNGWGTIP